MAPHRDRTNKFGNKLVASNRRARRDYDIVDSFEAGIVLSGSEVKALREGHAQIADSFARVINGQLWLDGVHIPPYQFAHGIGAHDPNRARKLLLNRNQIDKLEHKVNTERVSLVPLTFYFRDGRMKVLVGVGKGRKQTDKRQAMSERDTQMEIKKAMGRQAKGIGRR